MSETKRQSLDNTFADECAYSEIVEAGDFIFLIYKMVS